MCDIIVSNLPNKADVYFLNTLFDRQVKDSIWAGYGTARFAIVSLKSSAYGERLLEAQRAFLAAKALGFPQDQKRGGGRRSSKKSAAAAVAASDEGLSVEELLGDDFVGTTAADASTSSGTGNVKSAAAKKKKSAAAAAADDDVSSAQPIEVHPFYGDICCDDRILFFDRSPISVDDILATQRVPGRVEEAATGDDQKEAVVPKGKHAKKTPRAAPPAQDMAEVEIPVPAAKKTRVEAVVNNNNNNNNTDDAAAATTTTTTEVATTEKRQRHKAVKPKSTRLTFGEDEDDEQQQDHSEEKREDVEIIKPVKKSSSYIPSVEATHDSRVVEKKPTSSAPAPSTKHTTNIAAAVAAPAQPAAAAQPKPTPQLFARTSKDQCKFCGSDLHLSRHCPQKA